MRRIVCLVALATAMVLAAGCGNEPPTPAQISVTSVDSGTGAPYAAAVFLDGVDTGNFTPHTFDDLGDERYVLSVELPGFASDLGEFPVTPSFGEVRTIEFKMIADIGDITVTSTPAGAAIWIDGVDTGEVTPSTLSHPSGTYVVSVTLDTYTTFPPDRTIEVTAGSAETADFTLSQSTGSLAVTSTPAGAAIFLDGNDSDEITPFTFAGLGVGDYTVSVQLAGYSSEPAERTVSIVENETATADFTLTAQSTPRIVLLESFSNTYCAFCPAMNANLDFVLHQPGYGPERVINVKWPALLSPLDPFYRATQSLVEERVQYYYGSNTVNLPTLNVNGALLGAIGTPPSASAITAAIDAEAMDADFSIAVTTSEDLGDVTDLVHEATVQVLSPGGIDLTGHSLRVVLVYDVVETENEGYQDGITEYHWVMRDFATPTADVGVLAAGTPASWQVTLVDPLGGELSGHAIFPNVKQILAWVDNPTTKTVIQAGSTMATSTLTSGAADSSPSKSRQSLFGGSR